MPVNEKESMSVMMLREMLKDKLRKLFRFDVQDLHFGIYRIINHKRDLIHRFIEHDLIEAIELELKLALSSQVSAVEIKNESSSKNRRKVAGDLLSQQLRKRIYNHLLTFFSRYYEKGDFLSKRQFGRKARHVIPYNGEEVLLYWVNRDQYYVKTTNIFHNYSFIVNSKNEELVVRFRLVTTEEEKGNVKSGEKKFFVLNADSYDFDLERCELNIYFEYRSLNSDEKDELRKGKSLTQELVNKKISLTLKEKIPEQSLARIIFEEEGGKTIFDKHLHRFTRRHLTDYFIHKNLKGFLENELDFYIKNEFLDLKDLNVLKETPFLVMRENFWISMRMFRQIALKIINFLSQFEDFQKKIWEKKKFVIATHYVITLDKIERHAGVSFLESILDDILDNKAQLREWTELLGIKVKSKEDLWEEHLNSSGVVERKWKPLPLDTKHFTEDFKWKLLDALSERNDLDSLLDGLLIKSENWQALNFLMNKYQEQVQLIYIDPPFNTGSDFLYKDNYRDSCWLTLMENRLVLARRLLKENGCLFLHLNHDSNYYGRFLLDELFGKDNFVNEIIRVLKPGSVPKVGFGRKHETIYLYAKNKDRMYFTLKDVKERYSEHTLQRLKYRGSRLDYAPEKKAHITAMGRNPIDVWHDKKFYMLEGTEKENFGFVTQKPEALLKRIILSTTKKGDLVLDFFLGSGTTIAVAHKLGRKWIGVEMGEHFYEFYQGSVGKKKVGVLGRMKEVLAGFGRHEPCGISRGVKWSGGGFFSYLILEQYEDALENIELGTTADNLQQFPDYRARYFLEWESKNSRAFLALEALDNPFNYRLQVIGRGGIEIVTVDLIETFNYLLGLRLKKYKVISEDGRRYIFVFGEKKGYVAIVWRNLADLDYLKDAKVIEKHVSVWQPSMIYVNGDALIENFRIIELDFKRLMFESVS